MKQKKLFTVVNTRTLGSGRSELELANTSLSQNQVKSAKSLTCDAEQTESSAAPVDRVRKQD